MSATRNAPLAFIRAIPSSSINEPCSIERAPARSAVLIPSAPWAWGGGVGPALGGLIDGGADLVHHRLP